MKFPICLLKQDTGRRVFTHPINSKITLDIQVQYHQREDSLKSSHVTVYLYTNTLTYGRTLINHEWSVKINGQVHKRVCMNGFTYGHDMSIDLDLDDFIDVNHRDKVTLLLNFKILTQSEVESKFGNMNIKISEKKRYNEDLATTAYRMLNKQSPTKELLRYIKKSKSNILDKKEITAIKCLEQEKGSAEALSQLMLYLSCKENWFLKLMSILHNYCSGNEIYGCLKLIHLHYGDFKQGLMFNYLVTTTKEFMKTHKNLFTYVSLVLAIVAAVISVNTINIGKDTQVTDNYNIISNKAPTTTPSLSRQCAAYITFDELNIVHSEHPETTGGITMAAGHVAKGHTGDAIAINVGVHNNYLVIQESGLYFVYFSVGVMLIKGNNSAEKTCKTLFYYTYRVSTNISHTMVIAFTTVCSDVGVSGTPNYGGDVLHLNSGDKIYFRLHGDDQFELIPQSSYMGLFMVSPDNLSPSK